MKVTTRRLAATIAPALLALAIGGGLASPAQAFKLGMAVGGEAASNWQKAQGDVAHALATQRGWDYVELSNNLDPAVATKNADIFIQDKVDAVIQFNGRAEVNPVLAAKYAAAKIPVVTYDIAQKGFYFVGIDNLAAGIAGGEALGKIAKEKWNCDVDLVLSSEGAGAGPVNEWRTGGMRTGLQHICPDIPKEKYISFEGSGQVSVAAPAARDVLAAHPDAKKILVVGLNDAGVLGAVQAAEQLGRADDMIAWGQDGAFITGDNVNPHLAGSVLYFLEGYAVYALRDVIDPIAAGNPPPMKDTGDNPASQVKPCPVTAEQAKAIPGIDERVKQLMAAPPGTTEFDLFCPKS
jgi:ABC-type sugar transport system substrate-binding protein